MRKQGVSWAFTSVALVLTVGRCWIRFTIIKSMYWDDIAHLIGLILLLAQVTIVSAATSLMYQVGDFNSDSTTTQDQRDLSLFFSLNLAGILIDWCCLFSIKASFLLLYRHIFQVSKAFTRAWWTVSAFVLVAFWILVAGSLTECGKPSNFGNIGMRHCIFFILGLD